jgi:UDP-glucose 4-epimerase
MSERATALVTGGAGFVGAALVAQLFSHGDTVIAVDRVPLQEASRLTAYTGQHRFSYLQHDLAQDSGGDLLVEAAAAAGTVFHLAGNTENRSAHCAAHADLNSTVGGTVRVLDAVAASSTPTVVMASSQLVYDPRGRQCPRALQPRSLFGAGKMAAEGFLSGYAHEFGFRGRICRLSNIIGPDFGRGIIHDFVHQLSQDPTQLTVLGDGSQRRSFLHVQDCAAALIHVAGGTCQDTPVVALDVANTDDLSALEVAHIIATECPSGTPAITTEGTRQAWRGDVGTILIRPDELTATGWSPARGSADAVRDTARTMFSNLTKDTMR